MADIFGTPLDDSILPSGVSSGVTGGLPSDAADTIDGGDGNDTIDGGGGNDFIFGGNGNDTINGGAGQDNIDGGDGDDILNGGADTDTILAGNGNDIIQIQGSEAQFDAYNGGTGIDKIVNINSGADIIRNGFSSANLIEQWDNAGRAIVGNSNANNLDFSRTLLLNVSQVRGENGNDTITGAITDDNIAGGNNNDFLSGGALNLDIALALNPSISIEIDFSGSAGIQLTSMGRMGGSSAVNPTSDLDDYTVWRVRNGTGSDTTVTLKGQNGFIVYSGLVSANSDTFFASGYTDGSATHKLVYSGGTLTKAAGSNEFDYDSSLSGNDILTGDAGNDTLVGGTGNDTINANGGADRIRYNSSLEGLDTINAFTSGTDKFEFSNAGFGGTLGATGNFTSGDTRFITGAAPGSNTNYRFRFASNTLYFDADGSGSQAEVAMATGIGSMAATDIVVIA